MLCRLFLPFLFFTSLQATIDVSPSCFRQLQVHFFDDEAAVKQALNMNGIPESSWASVVTELKRREKEVPAIVKERAVKMRPNPLYRPYDAEAAEAILEAVLYEIFYETVKPYDIKGVANLKQAFGYIKRKRIADWEACFETDR